MDIKVLSYEEIKNIEHCVYKFTLYNSIADIRIIGRINKMYGHIFYGHKSRAFELFLALGSSRVALPDWVFEYFNYGNKITGTK
jgi:hypothetical protein